MNKLYFQFIFLFLSIATAMAQTPINDECESAIVIEDPLNFCSGFAAYTNIGATIPVPPLGYSDPSCYEASNDVWFSFTAVATDVVITVNGASASSPGGTLIGPGVTLYSGFCGGSINELECQENNGSDFVDLTQSGITAGTNLLVRVDGIGNNIGSFELCIRNFNPPVDPSSDCPDAGILCDKSSFTVEQLVGAGNDDTEFDQATCFNNGNTALEEEFNSVWFKWTCDQAGSLTFILTPTRPVADLDFVLFELPGGLDDCANKQILRCEAAGAAEALYPTPCHGPTGLSTAATDTNENAGCDQGQDNFIAPINMVAGRSYALGINNFGPGNEGFTIEFGGTGTFLGPEPDFIANPPVVACLEEVVFTDASSFPAANGNIVSWSWNFGQDANPQTADGTMPHTVTYDSWGTKYITLSIESDEGCIVTKIFPFEVEECCLPALDDLGLALVNTIDPVCNGDETGIAFVNATNGTPYLFFADDTSPGSPYYLYSYDNGPLQSTPTFAGLPAGVHEIRVVDRLGCEEFIQITINEPPPIIVNAGEDITVNLGETTDLDGFYTPMNIGDSIYWSPDSLLSCGDCLDPEALPAGTTTYELTAEDEFGCMDTDSITVFVTENRPLFIPNAFSPNFDGINDRFNIHTGPAVDLIESMEIYDRWGELVYRGTLIEPNNPNMGWDGTFRGKDMSAAVFAYVINVRFIDNVVLLYEGDVTLVR